MRDVARERPILRQRRRDFPHGGECTLDTDSGFERATMLQGFCPGEHRAYHHGETVTLVVRVRNVGKKEVTFKYIPAYFFDSPPSVTDGEGKTGPQVRVAGKGGNPNPVQVNLAPGKEIELAEVKLELRPASESGNKKENTLYGTGKFQIHYERVMYRSGRLDIGSILRDVATGTLDLEVKPDRPAEKK